VSETQEVLGRSRAPFAARAGRHSPAGPGTAPVGYDVVTTTNVSGIDDDGPSRHRTTFGLRGLLVAQSFTVQLDFGSHRIENVVLQWGVGLGGGMRRDAPSSGTERFQCGR